MYSINVFHTDIEDSEMHASVAQRIEQEPSNLLVGGSIPSWGTRTHERAPLPRHDRRAVLVGGQPVDEMVGHQAARQLAGGRDHVLVLASRLEHGAGRNQLVVALRDPRGQIDVVGCEVLDDPDVRDARRERALTTGADLVQVAQLARFEALAQLL